MQQVPSPECTSESSGNAGSSHETGARWSRIPRVQLLRNKSDQRVPLYFDQTVPVWPLREGVRSNHQSTNVSPASRSPVALQGVRGSGGQAVPVQVQLQQQGRGYGVQKAARKFEGNSQTVWFRSLDGVLKASSAEAHACNVSEILRSCGCESAMNAPGYPYALNSSRWSGIEQDLFTCTSVDPKVFVVPSTAEFVSNKKSKSCLNLNRKHHPPAFGS
ncbi:hypothetical protein M758_4G066600 [Ceratodon purpureus]|nr:hypothetical protein M758_4G066600 [Ceratodon purpureus]